MLDKFKQIGEYVTPNSDPVYKEFIGRKKSYRAPIVYLFVIDKEIKYIGETRGGYMRPLSYNKNIVMKRQREEILRETRNGKKVKVYAYEVKSKKVTINGMKVDCYLAQDYEKALIQKYKPEWNGRA